MYGNRVVASILFAAVFGLGATLIALASGISHTGATGTSPAEQQPAVVRDDNADPSVSHPAINISRQDLAAARQKWESLRTPEYTMHLECGGWMEEILNVPGNSPCGEWLLTVASGPADRLIDKKWLIPGDVISTASNEVVERATISSLFDLVEDLFDRTSNGTHYDTDENGEPIYYVVDFNETLGYPETITGYAPPSKLIPMLSETNQIAIVITVRNVELLK